MARCNFCTPHRMSQPSSSSILSGKVIVITGASSGAGRAAALTFARHHTILILAARREDALAELAAECEALGARTLAVPTDVTDAAAVKALATSAIAAAGKIDVWINNAGVLAAGTFEDTPVAVHDRVIQTNLMGYLHGAHIAVPIFKNQGYGILINNISIGGWLPVPYGVGYSASKFGLRGFNDALRAELSSWPDIHVCALYPAFLDTPGIQHAANYTGVVLRPAPPVFDPQRVADAMVALVKNPRPAVWTDAAAPLMRMAYGLFPDLVGRVAQWVMHTYFKKAAPEPNGTGNLFDTNTPLTDVHGGWKPMQRKALVGGGFLVAGAIAGFMLLNRRSR